MVMLYQGSNQSMDDPPQNQEHDDIVDPAPYLARDSASDWRPRGGGIMRMNNQGFEESNMEMTTCFYFPPSPTNFPLYPPMPSVFFVSSEQENISLALSCQHILEDKSGELHVINLEEAPNIMDLLFDDLKSYTENKFDDVLQIARAAGVLPKHVDKISDYDEREATVRRINWFEQDDVDIVDQPVYEQVAVVQQQIQNRGGELDVILGGGVLKLNGLEHRDGQGSPTTPEPLLILQAKASYRVWLAHDGQWVAEIRLRCSRLNNGRFTTVEDAISAYELVGRWSGWKDLTGFAGLFENENRSNLPLQLPLPAQELNLVEDFGLVCCNGTRNDEIDSVGTGSEGTADCIMADQARLNSGCLGKRKTKEKNPGGERRSKKTNGVRIAIPLEDILLTKGMSIKDAANHLGVSRSAQLNPDTLPSDQALAATIDTNSVVVKEIVAPLFLPIARQENLDEDFGNGVEAVGMGSERTGESETEDGQLNSWYLGKGKRKKMTPRGERRNKKTNGVRMTKEMLLKDPAKHLKGGEREAEPEPEAAEDEAADAAAGNAAHILVAEAIPLEDIPVIPQTKGVCLKDAAMNLNVSQSSLKYACREYGIPRWPPRKLITQSHPTETPALVDQEGIPQSNSDTLPSDQALAATVEKITSVIVKENLPPPFSPTARPERLDEDFGNVEAEAVFSQIPGIELTPRGERRNKETGGVRIAISLEEILQTKEMLLKDAAKHLKVSKSTLKRVCRGYDIPRWPPRGEHNLISQSCPNESFAVVDKEPIPQLNSYTLPLSNQVSATIGTKSVIVKARFGSTTMKFQLSWPWGTEELEEQVKKRLGHEAENYYINYKDEDNEYILIGCDEDLQDHISRSSLLGTNSIEVFLQPKPK